MLQIILTNSQDLSMMDKSEKMTVKDSKVSLFIIIILFGYSLSFCEKFFAKNGFQKQKVFK